MLPDSRDEILARLGPADRVLDVGGWAKPFPRADAVLDLLPYETRGLYGYTDADRAAERFTASDWTLHDICAAEPWPYADGAFDFAICSHTLEDVRDPVRVCAELSRVARAGYVEVPARLEEQAWGVQGPWVGWGHHRWLCGARAEGGLDIVVKPHILHGRPELQVPRAVWESAPAEARVVRVWWEGELPCEERLFWDPAAYDAYLAEVVPEDPAPRGRRLLRRCSTGR
jgi:Methyltransferase domain